MLIDTHAHVNFNAFKNDSGEVIGRSLDNDIWVINVGSQYSTSKRAVAMAEKYEKGVYAAIGLHPVHLESGLVKIKNDVEEIEFETFGEKFDYEKYKELAKSPKVVAIGEVGLDYYRNPKTKIKLELLKEAQKRVLLEQAKLARELSLPIIFHCRMAHDDLIKILADYPSAGVIHCFTGNWQQAQKYIEMGFYFGFNGIIFKMNLDEIISKVPLGRILLETDCPYLAPFPMVGRNEPIHIRYAAEKIAQIKKLSYEEIAVATTKNAKNLFKI